MAKTNIQTAEQRESLKSDSYRLILKLAFAAEDEMVRQAAQEAILHRYVDALCILPEDNRREALLALAGLTRGI